jgi:hypothetical protein
MQPPSAQSQAFDTTCSAWLGGWIDTIPLGFHRLLSDFRLLLLLRDTKRMRGTLPFVMTNHRIGRGLGTIIRFIEDERCARGSRAFPGIRGLLTEQAISHAHRRSTHPSPRECASALGNKSPRRSAHSRCPILSSMRSWRISTKT